MGIEYFLQQLVNGICLGGMYALMSVGYSLVYSIMNFSNFAHGGVIMVGAYVGYFALTALNVPFLPARPALPHSVRRGQRSARRHHRAAGLLAAA